MEATQSASGVKNEPIWRSLPPRAADEEACRKHYVITLRKCLVKVSFGDAGVKFWKLGKKISLKSLSLVSRRRQTMTDVHRNTHMSLTKERKKLCVLIATIYNLQSTVA